MNNNGKGSAPARTKKSILARLFIDTLTTSFVAFGGGFVVISMARSRFVERYKWFTDAEMSDLIAIAQSAPGAIAGNLVMLIGFNMAGVAGAIVTMAASMIPPLIIITLVSIFYSAVRDNQVVDYLMRGMRAGVGAVIASLVIDMVRDVTSRGKNLTAIIIMSVSLAASFFFKINPVYIIVTAAVVGIIMAFFNAKNAGKSKSGGSSEKGGHDDFS